MGWMRANKLKLNPDKTEVLLVGGSGFGEGGFDLALNGVALPLRDKVCSLGVLLDPELSLEAQVTAVARSAFLQLQLINQLCPYLEYDCLATVTHALVTSRLDFCNALYVGLPLKTVRILQLVQNRAARLLMGTGRYVHMTPVLRQLHWLPIEVRAQFKVLVMTYKALNGLGPGYLKERLHPYMPDRPLRSAGEALLREPSVKEIRRIPISYFLSVSVITKCSISKRQITPSSRSSRKRLNRTCPGTEPWGTLLITSCLSRLPVPSRPGLECLYLVLGDRDRLGILLVYRAPFCPTVSLPELTETVSDLVLRTPRTLVLGDFNLHAEASLTGAAQDFMASMTAMGLSQHVTGPTHERGHTLDLVFSTGQEEGGLRVRNLCLTPLSWSDHFLVRFVLESDLSFCKGADPIVWVRPRSRMNLEGFMNALGEFPADKTGAPVEALVELWNGEMTRAVDMIAQLVRVVQGLVRPGPKEDLIPPSKARCDNFAKNFREKIAQIRHELDSTIESEVLRETPMLPSGPELLDEFQLLRPDDVDKVLGRVRPTTCLLDPCPSWLIKDSKHGIGTWILEVVNASLREGQVPAPLKEAVVRPVLKKASLDPEMATNYRPVANIPFLGKVLERVVAGQLQALLDETDYLDPFQSGFRPGYGTESALVALYDDLCREKDRGSASLLVLLDLSAAFDTIDHGILLDRFAGLGVGGTALQWFRSYLNSRFQKVVLGDYGSAPWQLCHGVPQGSILSPLLFDIYMKPLGEVIRRCGLRNHQYADDTQLYLSFSTNPGEAVAVLNRCLVEVMGWMRANKLKFNPDKTEVLLVGGSGFGEGELNLVLNGVALPPRDKVRSLGVLLDPELSLEAQVTAAARSAFLQVRLIHQLRPYLEYDCLATVTHALVTSRLDFCNALHVGLPLKMVRILQLVQNRAARLLTGTGRYVHMTPVLQQLHWFPIEVRAQFKVLVMTYKALNGLGPGYLKERLRPYMPSCPLRSAGEALLREPSVKEIRRFPNDDLYTKVPVSGNYEYNPVAF
ncbi:putative RNA-directed DNA polymerase from transposon BS [Varanus komodoensis]|nr:putative RNA-directed DNA polymerase from transposon BS [Varanus komodoensis]